MRMSKWENANDYYEKNIKTNEKGIMENIEENVKKSEFKDYAVFRKYLIENPKRSIEYDSKNEMRPSCVERLNCLVKNFDNEPETIEEYNYIIEQQIIVWRGGY